MQALLPCCWEQAMDGLLDLSLFLLATFAAALVAGLAGFAFGLVAAAVWLHIFDPVQTAALIIGFGLVVQGYAVWKLRRALSLRRLLPFLVGAGFGVLNGILGGMTGLAGILVTIWCGLRGWNKDEQRGVFQPVGVAIFAMSALWLGAGGV